MRIAVLCVRWNADLFQDIGNSVPPFQATAPPLMDDQPFLNDLTDGKARAETGIGVLKDNLHLAAKRSEFRPAFVLDRLAIKHNLPLGGDQAQQRKTQRGLPGSAFPDNADRMPLFNVERNVIDGPDMIDSAPEQPFFYREINLQISARRDVGDGCILADGKSLWLRIEEHTGILMAGAEEYLLGRIGFDDLPVRHHADILRHFTDDAKIMGDQQDCHAETLLQVRQKFQNLRLNGHVESGCRLVRDQQLRLIGERHGDHDPLSLPSR